MVFKRHASMCVSEEAKCGKSTGWDAGLFGRIPAPGFAAGVMSDADK